MSVYYTIYADADDHQVASSNATWANVRSGSSLSLTTGAATLTAETTAAYSATQVFMRFDTSPISATPAKAWLSHYLTAATSNVFVYVKAISWTTASTSNWQTGLTVGDECASFATQTTLNAYYNTDDAGSGLAAALTPGGFSSFVIYRSGLTSPVNPTGTNSRTFSSADETGTTQDPYLVAIPSSGAWSFVGKSASVTTVTSGAVTPTEPSGAAQGDLLVACIAYRSNATFTLPSGGEWTLVATQQSSGNAVATNSAIASGLMAYCVRGASAPNYTFTRTAGDVAMANVYAYRGVNTTSPYDTGSANTLAADSATATTNTFSTAEDDELIVAMVSGGQEGTVSAFQSNSGSTIASSGTSANVTAAPAPNVFQERSDDQTTSGVDTSLTVADAVLTAAGATGTIQATHTNASVQHVMIAGAFKLAQAVKSRPLFRRPIMFFRRSF